MKARRSLRSPGVALTYRQSPHLRTNLLSEASHMQDWPMEIKRGFQRPGTLYSTQNNFKG